MLGKQIAGGVRRVLRPLDYACVVGEGRLRLEGHATITTSLLTCFLDLHEAGSDLLGLGSGVVLVVYRVVLVLT